MREFSSTPSPVAHHPTPRQQWDDMQGLVLSAYPAFDQAAYVLFEINDANLTKLWLAQYRDQVTTAFKYAPSNPSQQGRPRNLNIAFSYTGLRALGFDADYFNQPFVDGIAARAHRSRVLGDIDTSAPSHWDWGGPHTPRVDMLMMVFVTEFDDLQSEVDAIRPPSEAATEIRRLTATRLRDMNSREHFGFVDGISQPILAGTFDAERFPDSIHLTALGEVVLGYPDAYGVTLGERDIVGRMAPLPVLRRLPVVDDDQNFGRNGSYLVLRQLTQDVTAFNNYLSEATGSAHHDDPPARQLAAKIVGRWHEGTPLVPYATVDDNEFVYADDPYGAGCPIGAHVRRANPRDALINTGRPFRPTNDHRILRRGRSYGPPRAVSGATDERGLLFLCLNADLERQFEFIQQNWINNPVFGGLSNERDPLVGAGESVADTFTIAGLPARSCVHGLRRFVTVKGGQYFFLPGINALRSLTVTL